MAMEQRIEQTNDTPETIPYFGGNEVFFSFLQSLLVSVDAGALTMDGLAQALEQWGGMLLRQRGAAATLEGNLENLADTLSVLGLVRVFEPHEMTQDTKDILVLRCMISRYVNVPRIQQKLESPPILTWLVEGYLRAAGVSCQVSENRTSMLRNDEYILSINTGMPS